MAQLIYNKSVNATTGMTSIQSLIAYDASLCTDVKADIHEGEAPIAREQVKQLNENRILLKLAP